MPHVRAPWSLAVVIIAVVLCRADPVQTPSPLLSPSKGERGEATPLPSKGERGEGEPNWLLEVAGDWLDEGVREDIDKEKPVRSSFGGASVTGTNRTRGQSHLELIADPDRAVMETVLTGTGVLETVATSGPVEVYATSMIPFTARKRVHVDKEGVWKYETVAQAHTHSTMTGIGTSLPCLRDQIARKAAAKRYARNKADAEANASQQAEQELRTEIDKEAEPRLQELQTTFYDELDKLKKRGMLLENLAFSTTTTAVHMRAGFGAARERQAQTAAPSLPLKGAPFEKAPMSLRVHQSAFNHIGSTYAGKTYDGDELEKDAASWFGAAPEAKKSKAEEKPWSVTYAVKDPVSMTFADHGFVTVIRLKQFTSGDSVYDGMNITAKYRFQNTPKGSVAVRQGKLAIFPPGFVPDSGKKLSARQQTIRTVLERRFNRVFTEELHFKDIQPKEDSKNMSPLTVAYADGEQGWLLMAWRRAPRKK
jgi:hypothetical protein